MKNSYRIVLIVLAIGFYAFKNCSNPSAAVHQPNSNTLPQTTTQATAGVSSNNSGLPSKVYEVLHYVQANHQAPNGYEGGRHFGNFEGHLPQNDASGRRINYQEWDVNPHLEHKNRGTERLITGSDGKAYYTNDHYNTFTEVK